MMRTSPLKDITPVEPLDWERLVGPSCCVCGEVFVPENGVGNGNSDKGNSNKQGPASRAGGEGGGRGGGGGASGEESFVVLPDSTPVLSEDYFALARTRNHGDGGYGRGVASASAAIAAANSARGGGVRAVGASRIIGDCSGGGGDVSLAPGSELLESRYYSGYGGSGGLSGGWTGGSFGVGSSMLDSIVQISHAGLSDNVRRESLLYELSKRSARPWSPAGADGSTAAAAAAVVGQDGEEDEEDEEEHDPTLCCHCYASLLEKIDEDDRLAKREALAYRDFVEFLDRLSSALEGSAAGGGSNTGRRHGNAAARDNLVAGPGGTAAAGSGSGGGKPPEGDPHQPSDTRKESIKDWGAGDQPSSATPVDIRQQSQQHGGGGGGGGSKADRAQSSPFAQALRIARETSVHLRRELRSLEAQAAALGARGSEAWAALSELAYARGVLGDECRELLQVSREVAENAASLSARSALSELFSIRHTDGFPSINGYRLGSAPDDKRRLHWNEINAAWGEAVLLVRCVSNAIDFHSRRFRLVPLNCASRVLEIASGDDGGGGSGLSQERGNNGPESSTPSTAATAPAPSSFVVCAAHDLFYTGGSGNGVHEKRRHVAAIRAFLGCSAEVIAFLERRMLERRLEGEMSAGAACVAWSAGAGVPYKQTEDAVGGVSVASLKSRAAWKAWLCQLVKNLEWAVGAASSLCVA